MIRRLACLGMFAVILLFAVASARAATPSLCRPTAHESASFIVCTIDLRREEVKLFWKRPDGEPYGSFERLLADARPDSPLLLAMNAGMYAVDLSPVGLYVEEGRQLKRANTANGEGNFHLKPNGVFFISGGHAGILETDEYLRRRLSPELATQSGPMLLIDGRVHPQITEDGPSRKIRNGIGVRDPQTVLLAISNEPVSFGVFARLFRDELGCSNALFLDGSISSLYDPALGRRDAVHPMGPILGVVARPTATPRR